MLEAVCPLDGGEDPERGPVRERPEIVGIGQGRIQGRVVVTKWERGDLGEHVEDDIFLSARNEGGRYCEIGEDSGEKNEINQWAYC